MSCPAVAEVGAIIPCTKCARPHVKRYKSNRCIECKREQVRDAHRRFKYKKRPVPKSEMQDDTASLDAGMCKTWLRLSLRAC